MTFLCLLLESEQKKASHLDQSHLRAERQQDFLRLGRVRVVSVLVEPLLERPRHVLQSLALVSHFAAAGTTPVHQQGQHLDAGKQPDTPQGFSMQMSGMSTEESEKRPEPTGGTPEPADVSMVLLSTSPLAPKTAPLAADGTHFSRTSKRARGSGSPNIFLVIWISLNIVERISL